MIIRAQIIWLVLKLFSRLPLPIAHGIGVILGNIANLFSNRLRRVVEINLRCCFPELSPIVRSKLVRSTLIEIGKTVTEMGALWLWQPRDLLKLVKKTTGEEEFRMAIKQHHGVIAAGPHLGAWEMAGLYLSMNYPLTTLYRPPRLTELSENIRFARSRSGANLVATNTSGIKSLYQTLARGEVVAILPDHNPGRGAGIFAPFFGIATNTMVLLSRLAAKNHSPVYFVYAERLPHGVGFHLHFIPGDLQISNSDIAVSCAYLNAGIENCIRRHPHQYQWGYKRFKIRPEGEPDFYH